MSSNSMGSTQISKLGTNSWVQLVQDYSPIKIRNVKVYRRMMSADLQNLQIKQLQKSDNQPTDNEQISSDNALTYTPVAVKVKFDGEEKKFSFTDQQFDKYFKTTAWLRMNEREKAYQRIRWRMRTENYLSPLLKKRIPAYSFDASKVSRDSNKTEVNHDNELRYNNFSLLIPKGKTTAFRKQIKRKDWIPKSQSPDKIYENASDQEMYLKFDQSKSYVEFEKQSRPSTSKAQTVHTYDINKAIACEMRLKKNLNPNYNFGKLVDRSVLSSSQQRRMKSVQIQAYKNLYKF